jgi:DNA-binding CsgD family transcriptional regulator
LLPRSACPCARRRSTWITHGKSNEEITEILDRSPRAVNKHLEQNFNKRGIENRTAAATMSVRVLWDG